MSNPDFGPLSPSQNRFVLVPVVAASLTASIQPFPQHLFQLASKAAAHSAIVGDRIVVQVPYQPLLGALKNLSTSVPVSILLEPYLQLLELGSVLLLGRSSFHLELARPSPIAVKGES